MKKGKRMKTKDKGNKYIFVLNWRKKTNMHDCTDKFYDCAPSLLMSL